MRKRPSSFYLLVFALIALFFNADSLWAEETESAGSPVAPAQDLSSQESDTASLIKQKMQQAEGYHSAGRQLLQEGNYISADMEFKKAQLLLESISPVALSKPEPAIAAAEPLEAPVAEKPKEKAEVLITQEAAVDPIRCYQERLKSDPKNTALCYNLAVEYLKCNQFKNAEEEFKRILELDPQDKNAYYNLAVLYDSYFNRKKQAISYYNQYLKLSPRAEDRPQVKAWIKQLKKQLASEKI